MSNQTNFIMKQEQFPNGVLSWTETHYEVVSEIQFARANKEKQSDLIEEIQMSQGSTGFYELANTITDEFEEKNKGREWDGEFFDEVEEFVKSVLYP